MNFDKIFLIIIHVFFLKYSNCEESANEKLLFVQSIWRHGERSAIHNVYPINEEEWTQSFGGLGELTPKGIRQAYQLGKAIRQRYIIDKRFLPSGYQTNKIRIESTDLNRTLQTAQSVTMGIFPPNSSKTSNNNDWLSELSFVPIHPLRPYSFHADFNCSKDGYLVDLIFKTSAGKQWIQKWGEWSLKILKLYNLNPNYDKIGNVYDSITCQRAYFNETLYEKCPWYNEQFYEKLGQASRFLFQSKQGLINGDGSVDTIRVDIEKRKIQAGPIINSLYEEAMGKLKSLECEDCNLKSYVFKGYSAFDITVFRVLVILGLSHVTDPASLPEYTAAIFFEYYTKNREYYFKVLYRANDQSDIIPLTHLISLCEGKHLCPISVLEDIAHYYKPQPSIEKLCEMP